MASSDSRIHRQADLLSAGSITEPVASEHTAQYIAFEQAVLLADGWLVLTALATAMHSCGVARPNALM